MAVSAERRSELVRYDNVQIEVVIEGDGPAVVLLPSLARDSDDYDEVAEGLTAAGFRVLHRVRIEGTRSLRTAADPEPLGGAVFALTVDTPGTAARRWRADATS